MRHYIPAFAALAVSFMSSALVPALKADQSNKKTEITIDQPIAVEGAVLARIVRHEGARFTRRPNHRLDLRRRYEPPDQHHLRHTRLQGHACRRRHFRVLQIKGRSTDGAAHLVLPR